MKKTVRGSALVVGVVCVAVGVAVGVGGTLLYMKMHSGGLGDGKEIAVAVNETVSVPETIPELSETIEIPDTTEPETESQTEPETQTEPVTEQGGYITISVVGNEYLYGNQIYDLEDLIALLHQSETLPSVKIINEKASRKAYQELASALQNENIIVIRGEETETS